MDILSYKLGKNASGGGGGDTPEYFITNPTSQQNTIPKMIKKVPKINTANITNMSSMFSNLTSLEEIPSLNTSNVTNMTSMFYYCAILEEIPTLDTKNVTNMSNMFSYCFNLKKVGELNGESVTNITNIFNECVNLETFGGIKDLGKAYSTTSPADTSFYTLTLTRTSVITHDSLMNVINGLYDIATKGCNQQTLNIGPTNKAKLSDEEIAIATNKGWRVI